MKKKKYFLPMIIAAAALVTIIGAVWCFQYWQEFRSAEAARQRELERKIAAQPIVCEKIRKIDGVCYESEKESGVYVVMIENHSESRPQSGMADASLVYEAIVEAPITRFLAVFSDDVEVHKIGPVRSARPFYIDWAREFDSLFAHVGGSDAALKQLAGYKFDLNEFSQGKYFWRSGTRPQPHNVYTSSELLLKAAGDKGWKGNNDFLAWLFKPDALLADRGNVDSIRIDFMTPAYSVEWRYERTNNDYVRLQAGQAHTDAAGKAVRTKNVAVMYVQSKVIDDYGRRAVETIGNGKAMVFLDGQAVPAKWRRHGLTERTRFYDMDSGGEIRFNSGATWIEVVPNHYPAVVFSQAN